MPPLSEQFQRLLGIDIRELAGATIAGEIPLPGSLVNRLIEQQLTKRRVQIAGVTVQPHDGERLTIVVATGLRLLPTVKIEAQITEQPEFPRPAVLGLTWSLPGAGPLAMFAAPVLSYFKALPAGIRADSSRLAIDIGELLWTQGYGELLDFITRLWVTTREGVILARFEIRVPPLRAPEHL